MLSQRSIVNNLEIPFYKVVRAACYKEKNVFFFYFANLLSHSVVNWGIISIGPQLFKG